MLRLRKASRRRIQGRRGAATLDYMLLLGVILPLVAFVIPTSKKMIQLALRSALSDRAAENRVALVDSFAKWDAPKTKAAVSALTALGLDGKVLVVLGREDAVALRSFGNLPNVTTVDAVEVNTYDVLNADWVLFTEETLPTAKESK